MQTPADNILFINATLEVHCLPFKRMSLELLIPVPSVVKTNYERLLQQGYAVPFPYWAQIWPAATTLSTFLDNHHDYVVDKQVLELAAGLGLPSLVAAGLGAKKVCVSDQSEEAVQLLQQVINHNRFNNIESRLLDWHQLPDDLHPDVLLLSDINYDPAEFDTLSHVLTRFLQEGTLIILSTPQRLMAIPFIDRLLPWCIQQENQQIGETGVSIYVLKQS
ncbi:MAG TPA: methyltransferase [Niastella sp.]